MKTPSFVILSVILTVTASPLGDHVIFRRHNGAQPLARRYILESRMNIPPQCASISGSLPTSSDPSVTNVANSLTLPSDVFPTGTDFISASDPVPTAGGLVTGGPAIPTGPSSSRRSFGHSEELSFASFVETWETLCLSSGGDIYTDDPCSRLAGFASIDALMEFANPCDQQHIADSMITFAKSKGIKNKDSLIKFALQYRRHYRNSVEILGVIPSSFYCIERSINAELVGVHNAQISGSNPGIFGSPISPLAPFGSPGTCPFGMNADISSCSCVSNTSSGSSTSSDGSSLSSDGTASADSSTAATDSSNDAATTTDSSDVTATATDSSDVNATATDSSDVTATATDSSDVTATATDSSNVAATATDSSNVTTATTDSSNLTATATATDSASLASATDSSIITATDSAAVASATVAATNTFSTGANIQPTDISGDVNDPSGR